MCDAVYFNLLFNFKQFYTPYEKKAREKHFRFNTVILTNVEVSSINDVFLPTGDSNHLRGDAIRLGTVYVWDDSHDEILETIFEENN